MKLDRADVMGSEGKVDETQKATGGFLLEVGHDCKFEVVELVLA